MNLWKLFPESLLEIQGILSLPLFAIPFYGYVLYALFKHQEHRKELVIFLFLTVAASLIMFFTLGPRIGLLVPPLMLFSVMLMPIALLTLNILKKHTPGIWVWALTSVAGCLHSLSWSVWLFALARS